MGTCWDILWDKSRPKSFCSSKYMLNSSFSERVLLREPVHSLTLTCFGINGAAHGIKISPLSAQEHSKWQNGKTGLCNVILSTGPGSPLCPWEPNMVLLNAGLPQHCMNSIRNTCTEEQVSREYRCHKKDLNNWN